MIWVMLALLLPLVTAVVGLMTPTSTKAQHAVGVTGATASLAAAIALFAHVLSSGPVVVALGGWEAPFGIALVADTLAASMVLITALIGWAAAIYGVAELPLRQVQKRAVPLLHALLFGVTGAFLAGDLFNLYVWFEVLLIASFVLLAIDGTREALRASLVYVSINLVSSLFFLSAIGLLHGSTGTLNLAHLASIVPTLPDAAPVEAIAGLLLVAFGIKAALFPLFFWLPDSYHVPSATVAGVFAGLLTKVGVYAMVRVFPLLFSEEAWLFDLLLVLSVLTMVIGVLGAAAQKDIRHILSFHIISQIGYMTLGLALKTPLGLLGAVVYLLHHIVVKANLFFVGGLIRTRFGTTRLAELGGLLKRSPWLAVLFAIPALSLAGIPPLSGFWAKLLIVKAGIEAEAWGAVVASLAVGVLTIFSMAKIWSEAFWKEAPSSGQPASRRATWTMAIPIATLAAITVFIGLGAEFVVQVATTASEGLEPDTYITTVLGERP